MDMYVRMYDDLRKRPDDNPTLGIVLCSETDEDIARYSVLHGNEQLFASKYRLCLPTEEQLIRMDDVLNEFEREHSSDTNKKGYYLVKDTFTRRLVKKKNFYFFE